MTLKHSSDPIAQLMQEHDDALVQLKRLRQAVKSVSHDGYTMKQFKQIHGALKFIDQECSVHNQREESALFPVLERYVDGPTRIMRSDHKELQRRFTLLREAVRRVENRRDSFSAIKRLSDVTTDVVQVFVNHIHKENH